jgi:hypothetical protein
MVEINTFQLKKELTLFEKKILVLYATFLFVPKAAQLIV